VKSRHTDGGQRRLCWVTIGALNGSAVGLVLAGMGVFITLYSPAPRPSLFALLTLTCVTGVIGASIGLIQARRGTNPRRAIHSGFFGGLVWGVAACLGLLAWALL
jgi:hypothetical protein